MKTKKVSRTLIALIIVFSLILQMFLFFGHLRNNVFAEPEVTENGDFTVTAVWDFTNTADYNLYNTTIQNDAVNLSLATFYWNQTTQADFDLGTHNDTNSTPTGDVILVEEMKTINIIKTGDFSSGSNWSYESGKKILSLYNATGENAELGYTYSIGDNIEYLKPIADNDGTVTYWLSLSLYTLDTTSSSSEIGFRMSGPQPISQRSFFYFDLSDIPSVDVINNVTFYAKIDVDSFNANHVIDIHALDVARADTNAITLYNDCGNGSLYIDDDDSLRNGVNRVYHEWNLNSAASDLENNLSRGWFGIGIHEEGDNTERALLSTIESDFDPQLNVSFNSTVPVSLNETAYLNQTIFKPNTTPNLSEVVNLSFDYKIEKFLNTSADLVVMIDNVTVWNKSINSNTTWDTVYLDVGQCMTQSRDYNISLQLHMNVNSMTYVECIAKFDNINITTLGYAWSGNFLSQEFDPGSDVFWDEISWNYSTDSETDLTIRTRNSQDGSTWEDWSYEYSFSNGDQISSTKGKKIQFSANLTTNDYTITPILSDGNISYKRYSTNGSIEMNSDYEPANLRNWGTLTWIEQTNGETLTYWYSIDSGNTWNQTADGNLTSVSKSTGKIRFKTEFRTTSGIITPTLFKWNLTHEVSELPTLFGGVTPGFGFINTYFNFTVRYSDPEDDPPLKITLNITSGTSHIGSWDMFELNATDTNYTDGKWYSLNITDFLRGSNYTFHFAAKDPSGIWSIGDNKNGPYVVNSPPKIINENKYGAQGGTQYYNDYEAEDLEDENGLIWSLSTNSTWLIMDPITGNLSGTPPLGSKASYWVQVTVDDGNGGSDETNFTLVVGDTQNPFADAGEDQVVYEDDIVFFNGTNSSDNIGIINYTWAFGEGLGYGAVSSHTFTQEGVYIVALTVKDVNENEDIDLVYITVINRPPVADAGPDIIINEGEEIYFNASSSYDTPSDNESLVFLWDFDGNGIFNDGVGINVSYTWFEPKPVTVKLQIIDNDGDIAEDSVSVQVNNIAPVVDIGEYYTGEKGTEIIIIANAHDPGKIPLLFRWDWENDGIWDTNVSSENIINNTWDEEGIYEMVVQVSDGTAYVTDTALVEITKYNIPPELGDLGSRQIRFNTSFKIDLTPFIMDEDTPLSSMEVTTDDPEHISINGVEITLFYPEDKIGETVDVLVTVSDGTSSDSAILTVQITQNYPPTLKEPIPDVEFIEDEVAQDVFNLNDHFEDNDLGDVLEFDFITFDPNLIIIEINGFITFKTTANWAGNTTVRFFAEDPSGAYTDEWVLVTVTPINDPPIIINQITSTTIGEDGNWTIDLDLFFLDVDTFDLVFTCNYPEIKIDPITHEAVWVPGDKKQLEGVKFTANDGEHSVSLDPVDLRVVEQNPINWILIIPLIIAFIVFFMVYREMQYRYTVEEVFLVDNAGVLLVHISQWESKAIDAKLVSGMLTAVQEFVKDSFRGGNGGPEIKLDEGALGKLEYGDFQIVLERGTYTFLSAVISGNDSKRLRKRMKDVVDEFETKYSVVLADWDGDMARFDGAERIVGRLLKNHAGMKIATEDQSEEVMSENIEDEGITDIPDLPSGDFADVPSYYDETNGGKFNEEADSK